MHLIGLVGRVFVNGPGNLGSTPGQIIPKTLKWYLIPSCFIIIMIMSCRLHGYS